jgi:WD40 repeat protein
LWDIKRILEQGEFGPETAVIRLAQAERLWQISHVFNVDRSRIALLRFGRDYGTHYLMIWEFAQGTLLDQVSIDTSVPLWLALNTDETVLLTGGYRHLSLRDMQTGHTIALQPVSAENGILAVTISPDATRVAAAVKTENSLQLYEVTPDGELVFRKTLYHSRDVQALRFSDDGADLVSLSAEGVLRTWDTTL